MASLWTEQPELEGRHVLLRPMVRSDGPAIVDAASDGRLWELFYTSVPDADGIETYLDTALAEKGFGRAMPFVVIEKASGIIIGATRYLRMNEDALRRGGDAVYTMDLIEGVYWIRRVR